MLSQVCEHHCHTCTYIRTINVFCCLNVLPPAFSDTLQPLHKPMENPQALVLHSMYVRTHIVEAHCYVVVAVVYYVCMQSSKVHQGHWYTRDIGTPGTLVHQGHWCTRDIGAPGTLVHQGHWYTRDIMINTLNYTWVYLVSVQSIHELAHGSLAPHHPAQDIDGRQS